MKMDPDIYHEQIEEAANQFLRNFGSAFTGTPGGHIETDIAGAASVAGLTLLRQTFPQLESFPPGSVVLGTFVDKLYVEQQEMQAFFMNLAEQMGVDPIGAWDGTVPEEHSSMFETTDLTRVLEPALRQACAASHVPDEYFAHVAGLTTIKLIAAGHITGRLNENVGKSIAMSYLIAGSRTVPHPISTSRD